MDTARARTEPHPYLCPHTIQPMSIGHEKVSVILGFRGASGISLNVSCEEISLILQRHLALDGLASIRMSDPQSSKDSNSLIFV